MKNKAHLNFVLAVTPCFGACAGCGVDIALQTENDVAGNQEQTTTVEDVTVDDVAVDADTDVAVEAAADVEVNVDVSAVPVGGSEGDGTVAIGDGVRFTSTYRGVVFEERRLTPSIDDALDVASVEWIVRNPVFDEPTIIDDAAAFAWGAPSAQTDEGDEYLLTAAFDGDVENTVEWTTATRVCAPDCAPRSIAAVCRAEVIMRVWLADGSVRSATGEHTSARVTCPAP